jgi:hypothetical protein
MISPLARFPIGIGSRCLVDVVVEGGMTQA